MNKTSRSGVKKAGRNQEGRDSCSPLPSGRAEEYLLAIELKASPNPYAMRIKSTLTSLLLCLSIVALLAPVVVAQVSDKEKVKKELELSQELDKKTYALVGEIASGAPALKLPENRFFIFAAAADLLWKHDEPRAQSFLGGPKHYQPDEHLHR